MTSGDGGTTEGEPDGVIDLGPIDLDLESAPVQLGPALPVERTRALLAYLLLGLLAVIILTLIGLLGAHRLSVQDFNEVAGVVMSPIIGLLGAATGYYYGRGHR
jgi:hypothetical protein